MLKVKPNDLRLAAKVSAAVKDITAGKKLYWNSVHKLRAADGHLVLHTTDGSVWLDWYIPVEMSPDEAFDTYVPAVQFNDMANRSTDGDPYNITRSEGILHLSQGGKRNLRLREESPDDTYLLPKDPEGSVIHHWTCKSAYLAQALKFVAPFIDATNPAPNRSVGTISNNGIFMGGTPKKFARLEGLPTPPVPLSFKQKTAKVVSAFLATLSENVEVTIDTSHYTFTDPINKHKLIVSGESVVFPGNFQNLNGKEDQRLKIDNKSLQSSVTILSALLPAEADGLNLRIKGQGEIASLKLSTIGEDSRNSNDEIPLIRTFWTREDGELKQLIYGEAQSPPETRLAINARIFLDALVEMQGITLDVRYYGRQNLIYIQDEKAEETGLQRSILLNVQNVSADELISGVPEETPTTPPAANPPLEEGAALPPPPAEENLLTASATES